jgi:hypothetical protein
MKFTHSPFRKFTAAVAIVLMFVTAAFATPTALTTQQLIINNVAVSAGQLTLTFTACDTVNGNSFASTGREIVLINNTGGSTYTITITSVADQLGRSDTSLTSYSVAAGVIAAVEMKYQTGWVSGSTVSMTCSNAAVKFAIVQFN